MLKTILSISGKPGLYKLVSQGNNMLIVESLADKKRFPAYGNEKIISLGDIAMYTDCLLYTSFRFCKFFQTPAVFFRWPSGTFGTVDETADTAHLQQFILFRSRYILHHFGH